MALMKNELNSEPNKVLTVMTWKNYYQVLQVDPAAEKEIIEAAYRRLAAKYHPDVSKASDATFRMQEINEAYDTLCDPNKRFLYDKKLADRTSSVSTKYKRENAQYVKKGTATHPHDYQHRAECSVNISQNTLNEIHRYVQTHYPYISGGFLLGYESNKLHTVTAIFPVPNLRKGAESRTFWTIGPEDYLKAELSADKLGLSLVGIFHSSPDYPNRPSEYDREWAQPFFSYIITSVNRGKAVESRSWRLTEDRSKFEEEKINIG